MDSAEYLTLWVIGLIHHEQSLLGQIIIYACIPRVSSLPYNRTQKPGIHTGTSSVQLCSIAGGSSFASKNIDGISSFSPSTSVDCSAVCCVVNSLSRVHWRQDCYVGQQSPPLPSECMLKIEDASSSCCDDECGAAIYDGSIFLRPPSAYGRPGNNKTRNTITSDRASHV